MPLQRPQQWSRDPHDVNETPLAEAKRHTRAWLEFLPGAARALRGLRFETDPNPQQDVPEADNTDSMSSSGSESTDHDNHAPCGIPQVDPPVLPPDTTSLPLRHYITGFRTDGQRVAVNLASGSAVKPFNTDALLRPRYDYLQVLDPQASILGHRHGTHRLRQNATFSFQSLEEPEGGGGGDDGHWNIRITGVDPGVHKPVQCTTWEGSLTAFRALAPQNQDHDPGVISHMSISEDEWLEESGLLNWRYYHEKRVKRQHSYRLAIEALSGTEAQPGSRHASGPKYESYAKAFCLGIDIIMQEMVNRERRRVQWARDRQYQSYIRLKANQIAGTSSHPMQNPPNNQVNNNNEVNVVFQVNQVNIVFFGDALWPPTKGHLKLPKKRLLRELSYLCLVILTDEYNTSRQCPCGQPLEVDPDDDRHQRHPDRDLDQTCPFLSWSRDRDELASVNILYCGIRKLLGLPWPAALRR